MSPPYCKNEFGLSGADWDGKAPHSPHSLDLAPVDFYLFGQVKQLLAGHEFTDRGALLDAAQDILRGIEKLPCIRFFSFRWRDLSNILQSMETTLGKQTFALKVFADNPRLAKCSWKGGRPYKSRFLSEWIRS
jgi:hypothetical protein